MVSRTRVCRRLAVQLREAADLFDELATLLETPEASQAPPMSARRRVGRGALVAPETVPSDEARSQARTQLRLAQLEKPGTRRVGGSHGR